VGLISLAACGRRGSEADRAETVVMISAPAMTAGAPAVPFFEALGHNAENAYDQIKAADWGAARASVDAISAAMQQTQPQDTANRGADLRRSLARLDTAVVARARRPALGMANYLTKLGALLSLGRDTVMPAEVERGGMAEAARFDSIIASVKAARTPAQFGRTATPVLDQVDMLEGVFTR
jgi:hypothetical protein